MAGRSPTGGAADHQVSEFVLVLAGEDAVEVIARLLGGCEQLIGSAASRLRMMRLKGVISASQRGEETVVRIARLSEDPSEIAHRWVETRNVEP